MANADDYIFGNGVLHDRFRITTQILAVMVSSAPRAVSLSQLQSNTGRSARELEKLCDSLCRAMLLHADATVRGKWTLACAPSSVTLEDVFRCVITPPPDSAKAVAAMDSTHSDHLHHDVELLIMQAMMAVNQSVYKHLRQFSLDRLKASTSAQPPSSKRAVNGSSYDNEYDFEVNAWMV